MQAVLTVVFNNFGPLGGSFDAMVNRVLDAGVKACIAAADPLTRRDTGALVANKTVSGGGDTRILTWNQHYAGFQNFGTYKMSGTGFANAGADAGLAAMQAEMGGWP